MNLVQRANSAQNLLAKKIFLLMEEKKSNLCVALDRTKKKEILDFVEEIGDEIVLLKTHIDIVEDFDPSFLSDLKKIADQKRFFLFEDRKFADIGQTVYLQFCHGIHQIGKWADMVNAHIIAGEGTLQGLQKGMKTHQGLLLLAQMSSAGNLAQGEYTKKCVELAQKHPQSCIGFICQERLVDDPGFLHLTPGIKMKKGKDSLGQRYRILEEVDTDIPIVGRDITEAEDPVSKAREYRKEAWRCYVQRT